MGTGNTRFHRQHHLSTAVHPRGHGEHLTFQQRITDRYGSSPWARGTHVSSATQTAALRFIPVGTGNTHLRQSSKPNIAVHPRGHGEHEQLELPNKVDDGSSPWARGTPISLFGTPLEDRFIPVGTGNTMFRHLPRLRHPVHPRGHGEHS